VSDVQFFGESFALKHPDEYQWAMLEFAEVATGGIDDGTLEALAAVMTMLRAAIADDDFPRFRSAARKNKAQVKRDLMPVVVAAFRQEVVDHPTGQPSGSSDGPTSTEQRSVSVPAPQGLTLVQELEAEGRPDKAEFVAMAERARASA
jgi:hypothetical protein